MDSNRFDALVLRLATRPSRRQMVGVFVAALADGRLGTTLADERTAVSGNGGGATGSANGGAVHLGEIDSGSNAGVAVDDGETVGDVDILGGSVGNATDIDVAAVVVEPGPDADDTEDEDEDDYPYDDLYDGEYDGEPEDAETEDAAGEYPEPEEGGGEPEQPEPSPSPSPTLGTTPPAPSLTSAPTLTPVPPTATPAPTATVTPLPTATPVPTATPAPTGCPCPNANHSYCPGAQGKPNGCCPNPRCGQNRQSGAVCCNCGTGQCECVTPSCVPS